MAIGDLDPNVLDDTAQGVQEMEIRPVRGAVVRPHDDRKFARGVVDVVQEGCQVEDAVPVLDGHEDPQVRDDRGR